MEGARSRRGDEQHGADAPERADERLEIRRAGAVEPRHQRAALLHLVGALERHAGPIDEEQLRSQQEDALVEVLEVELSVGVAERAEVGAERHRHRSELVVAASGDQHLVSVGGGAVERQAVGRGELAVGRQAAGVAHEQVQMRVSLAGEAADLRADDPAGVAREILVDLGLLGLTLCGGHTVNLAVGHQLDPAGAAEANELLAAQAGDPALAVEHRHRGLAELVHGSGPRDVLLVEGVVGLPETEVGRHGGAPRWRQIR